MCIYASLSVGDLSDKQPTVQLLRLCLALSVGETEKYHNVENITFIFDQRKIMKIPIRIC